MLDQLDVEIAETVICEISSFSTMLILEKDMG